MRDSPLPSQGLSNFRDASLPSFQRKLEPSLILPLRKPPRKCNGNVDPGCAGMTTKRFFSTSCVFQ